MSIKSKLIENQKFANTNCESNIQFFIENIYSKADKIFKIYTVSEMEKMQKAIGTYIDDLYPIRKVEKLMLEHCKNLLLPLIHYRDGNICMICSVKTKNPHIDHIIPKSKFPSSHPWNLQSLCANCNMEKSNEILDHIPTMLEGAKYRSSILFSTLESKNTNFFVSDQKSFIVSLDMHYKLRHMALDQKSVEQFINHVISRKTPWDKTFNMVLELLKLVKKK